MVRSNVAAAVPATPTAHSSASHSSAVSSAASTLQPSAPPPTIATDIVAAHMVSLFHLMDSKSKGIPMRSSFSEDEGKVLTIDVAFNPLAPEAKHVGNFQGFYNASDAKESLSVEGHFEWFTRLTQRYTCSSLCCIFVRYLVPELLRRKIPELRTPDGMVVKLKDLQVHSIFCRAPPQARRHTFHFKTSYTSRIEDRSETVEQPPNASDPVSQQFCTHNVLICKTSGSVIDFCGGQFTGNVDQPLWFPTFEAMVASGTLPGDVLHLKTSLLSEIDEQISRDESSARGYLKMTGCNDKRPEKFAKLVVSNVMQGWDGICRQCFGACSNLSTCSRCKSVKYCGRLCQKKAWRKHKHECAGKGESEKKK